MKSVVLLFLVVVSAAAQLTTINATDLIRDSRATINSNFAWVDANKPTFAVGTSVPGSCTSGKQGYTHTATGTAYWCIGGVFVALAQAGASGDVVGPASATNGNFAAFDGATGKVLKDSAKTASDFAATSHAHSENGPANAHYMTTQAEAGLSAEANLGALTTGLVKVSVTGGVAAPTVAAAPDVTSLFSGSGDYLKSDGTKGTPVGAGDVTASASLTNNAVVLGDGGGKGVKASNVVFTGPTGLRSYALPDANKTLMATDTQIQASQVPAGLITPAMLSARERHIIITGSGTSGVLQDTDDQPAIWFNQSSGTMTITNVWCMTDSGTATAIQLQKGDGSPVNMLSGNLNCSASKSSTNTFVTGENVLGSGNNLDFYVVVAGGGSPHWVAIHFMVTYQ